MSILYSIGICTKAAFFSLFSILTNVFLSQKLTTTVNNGVRCHDVVQHPVRAKTYKEICVLSKSVSPRVTNILTRPPLAKV
ncbi:hypothetical protein XELAEV_18006033mg [Xenopus laevis]|uniref:Uncharacterized protein n=1 Tax=Xenopus laevis TaxID=8355 RepID=A0A974DYI5_XENLA|nr:hypothetical protein XELAEV_18006033mg [Xenopus laevis]